MAEPFVDIFKTELISDGIWRSRGQVELTILKGVGWYNRRRLQESLGDVPPVEFEHAYRASIADPDGGGSSRTPAMRSLRLLRHPELYDQ